MQPFSCGLTNVTSHAAVLTPVFQNMSANVQGAIVIVGVFSLMDPSEFFYCLRVNKFDAFCWLTSFLMTAFLGAEIGIASAVGLSILLFVIRNAFPRISTLGRLPGDDGTYGATRVYASADDLPAADGILAMRVEAPLFFGNVPLVRDAIEKRVDDARDEGEEVKALILDLSTATDFDASACHFIHEYGEELLRDGVTLILANPTETALVALVKANLVEQLGAANVHATMAEAVARAHEISGPQVAAKKV